MKIPSFSVILIFVVLVIVGAGIAPLLSLQYSPTVKGKNLTVSYSWPGASARVIESEVTSKLEGVVSTLSGIGDITSNSSKERGSINITLKPKTDIDAVKFELTTLIRRIYPKLPKEVSFPRITARSASSYNPFAGPYQRGYQSNEGVPVMTYTINSSLSPLKINDYAEEKIVKELALIPGLGSADLSGATSYVYDIEYNPEHIANLGITAGDISTAIGNNSGKESIIGNRDGVAIVLRTEGANESLKKIPVKNVKGRIITLEDISGITLREEMPASYSRINGLNTINLSIKAERGANNLEVIKAVKKKMAELEKIFPENFSAIIVQDQSTEIKGEINKILRRTVLSILILLGFVYLVSRSLRYLAVITVTLIANILIAFIFYYLFKLEIHIYSLAGITVSLGIVIDTSIIMISHYGYYKNRKAFIAILAALLTTIGALAIVFLLPENERNILLEFSAVIIINLSVSMAIALLLIPALIDTFPIRSVSAVRSLKATRRVIKFNNLYRRFILFGRGHKWIFILLIILGFGIPIHLLPSKIQKEENAFHRLYNKTIGGSFYQNKIKSIAEPLLGGSMRLFTKSRSFGGFYREPGKQQIYIGASLPDGCTVQQLNEIVTHMENYLTQFEQIKIFHTNVGSYNSASITISFKDEYENTSFPAMLQNEIISKAIDFGGANWTVRGIGEQYFNNNVSSGENRSNSIEMSGYNYDLLYKYCLVLADTLSNHQRVQGPVVAGAGGFGRIGKNEYYIEFDKEKLAGLNINPQTIFNTLIRKLSPSGSSSIKSEDDKIISVSIISDESKTFDIWNLRSEYLDIGDRKIKFSDIGKIEMRRSGNDIYKKNQQYMLSVAYDFVGPYELASKVRDREIKRMNSDVLPLGFKAGSDRMGYFMSSNSSYFWILLLIATIIYFICAILFESLTQPLIIIILIPISFIGLFLTFAFTKFTFDQGGFAALIMLSGISVNAGIYIINQYNLLKTTNRKSPVEPAGKSDAKSQRSELSLYIKAYNHKIIPILLTIISTVLGLVPFLTDGRNEVFWFSFAVGTMGGLLFSLIGIVFILPVWGKKRAS
ncbi:MAG: efflux RND transporter permease subunit [Bacteroidales bacterium]